MTKIDGWSKNEIIYAKNNRERAVDGAESFK